MTEREMQDLLWKYPEELLNEKLMPCAKEMPSTIGRLDLLFEDRRGNLVVVEVKKGVLQRGAIDQIQDYFGLVKGRYPDRAVELMVVANEIPRERRLALERLDIEPREITEKKFRDVAREVGYRLKSEEANNSIGNERGTASDSPVPDDPTQTQPELAPQWQGKLPPMARALDAAGQKLRKKYGNEIPRQALIDEVCRNTSYKRSSVIPSDFCYDLTNKGLGPNRMSLFLHRERGLYEYVGPNYRYEGRIQQNPRSPGK